MKGVRPVRSTHGGRPYPSYAELRAGPPAQHLERYDLWVVSRYESVAEVLRNPATFSSASGMSELLGGRLLVRAVDATGGHSRGNPEPGMASVLGVDNLSALRILIATDPPDHTRLRRLVARPFSPRAIAAMEARVRTICEGLVDDLVIAAARGQADLVRDVAYPLPVIVISEMLGIPTERRDDFKRWSDDAVGALSGTIDVRGARRSFGEMIEFFVQIVEERRARPSNDLISELISEDEDGQTLTAAEILLFCVLLLIAGNETTTNLISNGAWALFHHPAQAAHLKREPRLIASAVEEVLRYDTPVQWLMRATTRPTELGGCEMPEGARVLVLFGSANRDERRYAQPDAFLVDRNPSDHLGFGAGIHFCLGAGLARLEARVVASTLLARNLSLRPTGEPKRVPSVLLRGFESLPVTVDGARC